MPATSGIEAQSTSGMRRPYHALHGHWAGIPTQSMQLTPYPILANVRVADDPTGGYGKRYAVREDLAGAPARWAPTVERTR